MNRRLAKRCPVCGHTLAYETRTAEGRTPKRPSFADWWRRTVAFGDEPDPLRIDVVRCENPDCGFTRSNDGVGDWREVVFLGSQGVGKSTYIRSLIRAANQPNAPALGLTQVGDWGQVGRIDSLEPLSPNAMGLDHRPHFAEDLTSQPPAAAEPTAAASDDDLGEVEDAPVPPEEDDQPDQPVQAAQPDRREGGPRIYDANVRYDGNSRLVLFCDMPGEAFVPRVETLANHIPGLPSAELVLLVLPADALRDGVLQPAAQAASVITAVVRMRNAQGQQDLAPVALVISKSDELRDGSLKGFRDEWLENPDYTQPEDQLRDLLQRHSDEVEQFVKTLRPQLVSLLRDSFRSVSFHFVSATGHELGEDNRYERNETYRVLDPFLLHREWVV